MISLIVANRTDNREIIGNGRQTFHGLREKYPGCLSGDGSKLAPDFHRRLRLGVKRLVVTWTTIHPDQNTRIGLFPDRFTRRVDLSSGGTKNPA